MKIYLDTADVAQIERLLATNLFSGVTSNPAILKAAGLGPSTAQKFYACAVAAGAKEIFLQTFGQSADEQVRQALHYRSLGPEVRHQGGLHWGWSDSLRKTRAARCSS